MLTKVTGNDVMLAKVTGNDVMLTKVTGNDVMLTKAGAGRQRCRTCTAGDAAKAVSPNVLPCVSTASESCAQWPRLRAHTRVREDYTAPRTR